MNRPSKEIFKPPLVEASESRGACSLPGSTASAPPEARNSAQAFVIGAVKTPLGAAPQASASLSARDRWGAFKARWGVGRMKYTVQPGLYALGRPDEDSPVLVTANYKMSFDELRRRLPGRDVWILVLDTKGINVWCAAGKGSFGTAELVRRVAEAHLEEIVAHRRLILPQLAGPGVAAHQVKKFSGFEVVYGPVRAVDLPAFLDSGLKATPQMRRQTFPLWERAVLIPVELVSALKVMLLVAAAMFFLAGLGGPGPYWAKVSRDGLLAVSALASGLVAGAIILPLTLPWLPGRAFSLKGVWLGLAAAAVVLGLGGGPWNSRPALLESAAWLLLIPALAAYLALNFTGASTYTSLSGVKREMRLALPFMIGAGVVGLGLWFGSRFAV